MYTCIHCNIVTNLGSNTNYVYINGLKQHEFKTEASEIINRALCLGNIVQYDDESVQKKTYFNGGIYHFSWQYT